MKKLLLGLCLLLSTVAFGQKIKADTVTLPTTSPQNPPAGEGRIGFDGTNMYCLKSDGSSCVSTGGSGAVDSVNGQTGVVVLTKSDVSLGNADNTSDANKPISTATQTALNNKTTDIGQFNPAADGTTDDSAVFTTAQATYKEIWLKPNTNYAIGTNLSLSADLRFLAGSKLVIKTGVTLTLTGKIIAPLDQIFTIEGTGKVMLGTGASQTDLYPEWWGAKGDATNDDTAAIQAAITCASVNGLGIAAAATPGGATVWLGPKVYKTTSVLTIASSWVHLKGAGMRLSFIKSASATADILYLHGTNLSTGAVAWNQLADFTVSRSVANTSITNAGVRYEYTFYVSTTRVESIDSASCFKLSTATYAHTDFHDSITSVALGAVRYGWEYSQAQTSSHNIRGVTSGGSIAGMSLTNVTDLFLDNYENAGSAIGLYITGSGGNILVTQPVIDGSNGGISVTNFTGDRPVQIVGGYIYNAQVPYTFDNATNVTVIGGETNSSTLTSIPSVRFLTASTNIVIQGLSIRQTATSRPAMQIRGSGNTIMGNIIRGDTAGTTAIDVISGTRNIISNNLIKGTYTTGINLDAASNNNSIGGNSIDPTSITTPINNLGTGNTFVAPSFTGALIGNASTATALAANGTNCTAGDAAAGVDASGNAEGCFTPSGSGNTTSTSLTTNTIPKANGANSIVNSLVTDDGTTLGYSGTGGIATSGTGGGQVALSGSTSGAVTLVVPAVAGTNTVTIPAATGTVALTGIDIDSSNQVTATHLAAALPVAQGGTNLTASTDDNVMVGNGTTWQSKAVPDCTDTGGNHLNYTASTNALSCGTSSSGSGSSSPDLTRVTMRDDFIGYATNAALSYSGSDTGWGQNNISVGGTSARVPSVFPHVGIVRLAGTTTTTGNGITIRWGDNGNGVELFNAFSSVTYDVTFIVRPGVTANGQYLVGFHSSAAAYRQNGCFAKYDTTNSDTTWKFECGNGGTYTTVDSTVAPSTTNWSKIRIYSTVAGTVNFAVCNGDGCTLPTSGSGFGTISTNIPTSGADVMLQAVNANSVQALLDVDWVSMSFAVAR